MEAEDDSPAPFGMFPQNTISKPCGREKPLPRHSAMTRVMAECLGSGFSLPHGFDIVFWGNIPNGAGLSSSASIELVTAVILKECHELEADMLP